MMERVDQERPGWDGDQFEVLTEEEVVGVGGEVAGMVTEDGKEAGGPVGDGREEAGLLLDGAGAGAGGEESGEASGEASGEESGEEGPDEGGGGGEVWAEEEGLGEEGRWEGNSEDAGHGEGGGDDGGDQGEDRGEDEGVVLLRRLVSDFNVKTLAEKTGVAEGVLVECHLGVRDLDEGVLAKLLAFERERPDGGQGGEVGEEEWEDDDGDPDDGYVYAVDTDGDGVPDFEVPGVKRVVKGEKWSEMMERRRRSLWSARSLALMTQFRLGMTEEEQVAAVGFLTQVELVLIMGFDESVPDPGVSWDVEKRSREIERRLARLRWVEEKQREEFGGWKGVWRAVVGRKKVSGKELFQKMLDEADGMMTSMSGVGQSEEVMEKSCSSAGWVFLVRGREVPGGGVPRLGAWAFRGGCWRRGRRAAMGTVRGRHRGAEDRWLGGSKK